MAEIVPIRPTDLLLDAQNPRIIEPNLGQHGAQQALAKHQQRKLQVLCRDIVQYGMNPSDLPIIIPFEDDLKRYVVAEGNRRLTALKALENPESIVDVVPKGLLAEIRKLSKQYQDNPVEFVNCVVMNRDEARHWIELRHTGENQGAGIVPWGSDESARFRSRTGKVEPHQQALGLLEQRGLLTPELRKKVPTTSLKRLMISQSVRSRIGVEVRDGQLCLLADADSVGQALMYIVNDLVSKSTRVVDIYTKEQRDKYAKKIPASIAVKATVAQGQGTPVDSTVVPSKPRSPGRLRRVSPRKKMIPADCMMNITDPRCMQIARELKRLNLDEFPNAVSVLFRVFVELSADAYVQRMSLAVSEKDTLQHKLTLVSKDLVTHRKLTDQQARPVRKACQRESFLAGSVTLMHSYVHNKHIFPAPGDLRAGWDSLQPFMIAMWAR